MQALAAHIRRPAARAVVLVVALDGQARTFAGALTTSSSAAGFRLTQAAQAPFM